MSRAYVITFVVNGQPGTLIESHPTRIAAEQRGLALLTGHGVVSVRPLVEMTYQEGASRFPYQLHKDAFTDAWRGWHERAERDFLNVPAADKFAANDARALGMQMNCAGPVGEFDRYHQLGGL